MTLTAVRQLMLDRTLRLRVARNFRFKIHSPADYVARRPAQPV